MMSVRPPSVWVTSRATAANAPSRTSRRPVQRSGRVTCGEAMTTIAVAIASGPTTSTGRGSVVTIVRSVSCHPPEDGRETSSEATSVIAAPRR